MEAMVHPKYREWRDALNAMIRAEEDFFEKIATTTETEAREEAIAQLHRARQAFWDIAHNLLVD